MTDSTEDNHFFQFPLSLMNFRAEQKQRLETMLDYAVMTYARKITADMEPDERIEASRTVPEEGLPSGFKATNRDHQLYVIGMQRLDVTGGSMARVVINLNAACEHIRVYEKEHGHDAVARVRNDLWFSCYNNEMSWRDFSVLLGLYSIIGSKPYPVIVYRSMLQARQLGYKSPEIMASMLTARKDLKPLTEDQIRYTLDRLECAGWFARMQASPRKVYFSNRLTRQEMADKLIAKATAQGKARRNRQDDAKLKTRLAQLRAGQ